MKLDLTGHRYGNLLVIKESHTNKKIVYWKCVCDCGKETIVQRNHLRSGHTKSCGCLWVKNLKEMHITHGANVGGEVKPEYLAWCHMKSRCTNPNVERYPEYGGRGIKVCERWLGENGFANFYSDLGDKPTPNHSLDRYPDVNGDYEPANVRWGTDEQQSRNKRNNHFYEYMGERMIAVDWAKRLGVTKGAIQNAIKRGKTFQEVVEHFKKTRGCHK